MIVLDASAAVELLLGSRAGTALADRFLTGDEQLHAPHLLDVEVAHVLRRLTAAREVSGDRANEAVEDLLALPLERYPHAPFLRRAWELRRSITPYDAVYVALAEALDAPLVTCDRRLARSHGHRASILLV